MTLNQVKDRIKTLALSHLQINSFYFGDLSEFDANGEINYPACFLEMQPGRFDRTEHLQYYNFRIYLLDLVPESTESEVNETDVLSDQHSVCGDILAMLMYSDYQDDWVIGDLSIVTPVTESLNDLVAGVYADIEIGVDFLADRCQVPSTDVTFENDFIGKLAYQENIILSSFPYPFQNSPLITRLVINSAHNTTDLDLLSNFFKSHLSINK